MIEWTKQAPEVRGNFPEFIGFDGGDIVGNIKRREWMDKPFDFEGSVWYERKEAPGTVRYISVMVTGPTVRHVVQRLDEVYAKLGAVMEAL